MEYQQLLLTMKKGQDLVDAIDKANIGTLKIISLADVKKYNVLAFFGQKRMEIFFEKK